MPPKTAPIILAYRALWHVIGMMLPILLKWRARQGKEDAERIGERYGMATQKRPQGQLFWLHGASVGETVSSIVLAETLLKKAPDAHILITSGTITSAEMMRQRVTSDRIIYQYHPHDHPRWITRFLDHWMPDLVVMMESEIWPNMVTLSDRRGIPVAMASAQVSAKSLHKWRTHGRLMARAIFPRLKKILAVDASQADRFKTLNGGPDKIFIGGSMKAAARPLPDAPELRDAITKAADGRQVILLASSHDGEEDLFADAIHAINQNNSYFAVIAPRHIGRGDLLRQKIEAQGHAIGQHSQGEPPHHDMSFWIADMMGAMGGLIRAADVVVLGGGYNPLGGHNPMEMASLNKGVISGPHVFKNKYIFDLLASYEGVIFTEHAAALAEAITVLTASPTALEKFNQGAIRAANAISLSAEDTAQHLLDLTQDKSGGQQ